MEEVEHDENYELKDEVKLGFKPTKSNHLRGLLKYDGRKGEIAGPFKRGMKTYCPKEHKFEELIQTVKGKKIECTGFKECGNYIKKAGDKHLNCKECDINWCEECMYDKEKDRIPVKCFDDEVKNLKPEAIVHKDSKLLPG